TKGWSAGGGEGPATHTDAWTTTLTLRREGKTTSIACHGERPEPYASLLRELSGLALQERRVYLHDYVSGAEGTQAWREIGDELIALRGDRRGASLLPPPHPPPLPPSPPLLPPLFNTPPPA